MLAQAGGVALVPDVAQIKIERGGQTGRIWLQDLYDNPRYDIALRAGDRIIVEEDRRSFTALGATTGQARVPFNKRDMSVIEAIATRRRPRRPRRQSRPASSSSATSPPRSPTACSAAATSSVRSAWPTSST